MSDSKLTALDKVKLPAIALLVVGILGIISAIYSTLNVAFGFTGALWENIEMPSEARQFLAMSSTYWLVDVAVNAVGSSFLIWASLQMLKLRSHTASMVASALALVPCWGACCCLGIPVGIWSLIVLLKPEVKSEFE